ncbi:transglycosylase SLT domain-containing protein [Halomonas sp. HK25]|uniref:transglycosylase SLT domain-containing protein n=1 Tax=Halomonas sp. HK25 TaxID=3394321 RepID=UPI0039FD1153
MEWKACRRLVMGCALGCGLAVVSSFAKAASVPPAYFDAASLHQVPPEVLYAVATAESVVSLEAGRRPWPWTLNVAGEGFHFATRQAACDALVLALKETRVVDVGIAQLNVRWQPQLFGPGKRFPDPCDALDPYANLEEAARLLRGHFDATGNWVQAAGRYHRPAGGEPAARYRRIVAAELERLGTSRQRQLAGN